jgi:hypothetical protein
VIDIIEAAGEAIIEGRLRDAWRGSISIVPSNEPGPLGVIEWYPSRAEVVMHRTLRESPRLPYFAHKIPSTLAVLEAAAHYAAGPLQQKPVLLNLDDAPSPHGIAFCLEGDNENLLIPDPNFIRANAYHDLRRHYESTPCWQQRIPVVFWRGGTSGRKPGSDWQKLPRLELCRRALGNTKFDVGISHVGQLPDGANAEIRAAGLLRGRVPAELFRYYRAHLAIDGNSWPTGLYVTMLTGTPVIKIASSYGFHQWWYDRLKPWVHFVPVEADMSDLDDKADWVLADGERAEEIGRAAQAVTIAMTVPSEVTEAGKRVARVVSTTVQQSAVPAESGPVMQALIEADRTASAPIGESKMTGHASFLMDQIHGTDVYAGFVPLLAADLQGWNSQHGCFRDIIGSIRPDTVIDVGVWKGGSTIFLANIMRDNCIDGAVIGVDSFLGSPDHSYKDSNVYGLIARQFGRPLLYEQFLANVIRYEAQGIIVPFAQSTENAAHVLLRLGVKAGLIHIDAAHDYESVLRDSRAYWELLVPGGYMVGDDYDPSWPGVVKAADQFAAELGLKIDNRPPKWILRKQK